MPNLEKQLGAARADLATAETNLAAILAGEDVAATTAKEYATWRSSKADATVEVERLNRLVAKLTADIEVEAKAKADEAQAALEADADRTADAAAAAITEGMTMVHDIVRKLMRAIVIANDKVALAQRGRRSDRPRLPTAEERARAGNKLVPQVITTREFSAWSYEDEPRRMPIPDELAARVATGPGKNRGRFNTESGAHFVVLRRYRETRFLPEYAGDHMEPLAEVLAVPPIRAGGAVGWTPMKHATNADILRQLDALAALDAEPDRRRPETKIDCLGDVSEPDEAAA